MAFDPVQWIDQWLLDPVFGLAGLDAPRWISQLIVWILYASTLFTVVLGAGGVFTFIFRRLFAFFTQRLGPNRVGPFGLFQLIADALKLITKEDVTPARVDKPLFRMAPYLAITPFVMAFAPMPFTNQLVFSNVAVGVVFILAISALSPLAEITAGWASNNKYSLYGGVRAAALDFSYEIPLVLSVISVVLMTGTMSTVEIVEAQRHLWFVVPLILGAFVFFVAAIAKAGLVPTDLAEAESELVAGFTTEYSGMRFGFFYVVLFSQVFFISAMVTTLFLGGWLSPFGPLHGLLTPLGDGVLWFLLKTVFFCFLIFWMWLTLPRVRIDQYLNVAWKFLFPLSLLNLAIAAGVRWYLNG